MDAVKESTEERKEKHFTIISLPAVIWAKVGEKSLTVRVQGEPEAVTIYDTDELFNFYSDKFKGHRDEMIRPIVANVTPLTPVV